MIDNNVVPIIIIDLSSTSLPIIFKLYANWPLYQDLPDHNDHQHRPDHLNDQADDRP